MEIKLFRSGKKLMCRLPGEEKDTPAGELFLAIMFFKAEALKEKFGNEKPVFIPTCEVSKQEEADIAKLNAYFEALYN